MLRVILIIIRLLPIRWGILGLHTRRKISWSDDRL